MTEVMNEPVTRENHPDVPMHIHLGVEAFIAWTSYGLPFEITADICRDEGVVAPSRKAFDRLMQWHREQSKRPPKKKQGE
jgi:alanyl-tRNA synthetase